jgi:hypothetical protein
MCGSNHRNHTVLATALPDYLRWRNANARHPDVLEAQRRERARIRSERQRRWAELHPARPSPKQPEPHTGTYVLNALRGCLRLHGSSSNRTVHRYPDSGGDPSTELVQPSGDQHVPDLEEQHGDDRDEYADPRDVQA